MIGDWLTYPKITMVMLHVSCSCRQGDRACQMLWSKPEGVLILQEKPRGNPNMRFNLGNVLELAHYLSIFERINDDFHHPVIIVKIS